MIMTEINVCPSTLQEGFKSYSPTALRQLFDNKKVSHILDFDSPNNDESHNEDYVNNVGRISLSGVQPKFSLILKKDNKLVMTTGEERGRYILKTMPISYALLERKFCPANETSAMKNVLTLFASM